VDDDLLVVEANCEQDPDGSQLTSCLLAHFARERAHARFGLVLRLWLATSVVMGLSAVWPGFPPAPWRVSLLVAWIALGAGAVGLAILEQYWKRKLETHATGVEPGETPR
jgi:hypothetical protein